MIVLISPAKTMDLDPYPFAYSTEPEYQKEIKELTGIMKKKPKAEIQELMGVSENIAALNKERYKNFKNKFTEENSKPAIFTFKGDVYRNMDVKAYSSEQLDYAQKHLRILSGLYGLLKPLDLIQPYRLEMGIKLPSKKAKDLYGFWKPKISPAIDKASKNNVVINLASKEYFKAVDGKKLKSKVIHITFKEHRDGDYQTIGIYAKQARGLMADYIIKNQISDAEKIKLFNEEGYEYSDKMSSDLNWVYIR